MTESSHPEGFWGKNQHRSIYLNTDSLSSALADRNHIMEQHMLQEKQCNDCTFDTFIQRQFYSSSIFILF